MLWRGTIALGLTLNRKNISRQWLIWIKLRRSIPIRSCLTSDAAGFIISKENSRRRLKTTTRLSRSIPITPLLGIIAARRSLGSIKCARQLPIMTKRLRSIPITPKRMKIAARLSVLLGMRKKPPPIFIVPISLIAQIREPTKSSKRLFRSSVAANHSTLWSF